MNLQDWILLISKGKSAEFLELFISLLWTVWRSRNVLVFQGKSTNHIDCFHLAQMMLSEYQEANRRIPPPVHNQAATAPATARWHPPPAGFIKLNSDASLCADGGAGLGGAFRNHSGELLLPFASFQPNCQVVEVAEGLACLQGIRMARDSGFCNLIVEMDNQCLIIALQKGLIPHTPAGTIIADILQISKVFHSICFQWIGRHQNCLAHFIASNARNPLFCFDVDNPPYVALMQIVSSDANFSPQ